MTVVSAGAAPLGTVCVGTPVFWLLVAFTPPQTIARKGASTLWSHQDKK